MADPGGCGDPSAEQVEQKHKEGRVDIDDIRRISFQQGFVIADTKQGTEPGQQHVEYREAVDVIHTAFIGLIDEAENQVHNLPVKYRTNHQQQGDDRVIAEFEFTGQDKVKRDGNQGNFVESGGDQDTGQEFPELLPLHVFYGKEINGKGDKMPDGVHRVEKIPQRDEKEYR